MSSQLTSWFIEKYARFVPAGSQDCACIGTKTFDTSEKGEWKYFCTGGIITKMKIAVVAPLNLLITSGQNVVLESFSLLGNDKESWIKAICKGDSMLFFYRLKGDARRFRIKFADGAKSTSQENCLDFVKSISKYIPVNTVESENVGCSQASQSMLMDQSQTQLGSSLEYDYVPPVKSKKTLDEPAGKVTDAELFATKSVRQLAEALIKNSADSLPGCYKSTNTKGSANIDAMVKCCLLDPNFPAFVGQVEQSLNSFTSS